MSEPLYRNEEWLREQYRDLSRSSLDIAEECDVHEATICKWLNRHNINVRSDKEQAEVYHEKNEWNKLRDLEWVQEKYIKQDLTTYELADLCDVTRTTVTYWLNKHDIEIDDTGPSSWGDVEKLKDKEWLEKEYRDKERSTTEIAEGLDVARGTVNSYLHHHDIPVRDISGENSHFYNGGDGGKYGPRWENQRLKALLRDQYRCQRCGLTEPYHIQKWNRGINVHHKTPYREFDDDEQAHRLENLISLCLSCHMEVEYNDEVTV